MGLDMYARVTSQRIDEDVDFEGNDSAQLHYWRKHPDLHGWMEQLYRDKGGSAERFNCVSVKLEAADLDRLEAAIRRGRLPRTEGFFFGESDGTEAADDLDFIQKARQALGENLTVFYSSWW